MRTRSFLFKATVFLSLFLLLVLIATVIPLPRQDKVVDLSENKIIPLTYDAQLISPAILRVGERGKLILNLQPQIISETSPKTTDNLLLETRLDMPGARVSPPGSVSQPLIQGKGLDFKWQVIPLRAGKTVGILWVSIYQGDNTRGEMERTPFMAYPLDVTVISMFGMAAPLVKWIAGIGLLICLVYLATYGWKS